ncbi:hypothetical protein SCP_0607480 [Sparassis crispa]|uniref:F-box domain-containing protein n=1 Tax=Sparassis crispa TaxID=139825 RepID=A0A401GRB0_9APHY|nr:hypothetical protein SCP_0607480 [Sparassis crispa]GBE84768.1 hypothetical protein SCP_0607480 [Sparassis crispa]
MYTLVPLFKTLPPDTWYDIPVKDGLYSRFQLVGFPDVDARRLAQLESGQMHLTRFLGKMTTVDVDIKRFAHYSARIKNLHWTTLDDIAIPTLLHVIGKWSSPGGSLPNLRSLKWTLYNHEVNCLVLKLPGPAIRSIELSHIDSKMSSRALTGTNVFLDHMQLDQLVLNGSSRNPTAEDTIIQLVRATSVLQKVSFANISMTVTAICALAVLPSLTWARFCVRSEDLRTAVIPRGFSHLQHLYITPDTLGIGTLNLLKSLQSPLQRLVLEPVSCPFASAFHEHLKFLALSPFMYTLLELWFEVRCKGLNHEHPVVDNVKPSLAFFKITSVELAPLLNMGQLTRLSIRSPHLAVDAPFLARLAVALPVIERLHVGHGNSFSSETRPPVNPRADRSTFIPLSSLLPFAEHCLHLREVGFDINADEQAVDSAAMPRDAWLSRSKVRQLCVYRGHITDATIALRYLRHLFPQLRALSHTWNEWPRIPLLLRGKQTKRWSEVSRALSAGQSASATSATEGGVVWN